jgi:hypothetical protein
MLVRNGTARAPDLALLRCHRGRDDVAADVDGEKPRISFAAGN